MKDDNDVNVKLYKHLISSLKRRKICLKDIDEEINFRKSHGGISNHNKLFFILTKELEGIRLYWNE